MTKPKAIAHSGEEAGNVLGISARTLRRLFADGVIHKSAHGKYDFPDYVRAYIAHVERGKVAGSVAEAELQLKNAQTRKLQLHNDHTAGTLVKRAAIEQAASLAQHELNAELDGLPGRLCSEMAAQTDAAVIRHRLRQEIIDVRNNYAARLARVVGTITSRGAEAEVPDASAVGKRKPRAATGKRRAGKIQK